MFLHVVNRLWMVREGGWMHIVQLTLSVVTDGAGTQLVTTHTHTHTLHLTRSQ
jgi:hypothetical protein